MRRSVQMDGQITPQRLNAPRQNEEDLSRFDLCGELLLLKPASHH